MAISSYASNPLDENTNTFADWLARTNIIYEDLGTRILSASVAGDSATGNSLLEGSFQANTGYFETLNGGTIDTPADLIFSTNAVFNSIRFTVNNSIYDINTGEVSVNSNNAVYTGNTISYSTDNVFYNNDLVRFNSTNVEFTGNTDVDFSSNVVNFSGNEVNFNANANFSGVNIDNGDLTANNFVGNGSQLTDINASRLGSVDAANFVRNDQNGNITGNLTVSGTVSAADLNSTSDRNLKDNIESIENGMDILKSIRGVSFNWKGNGNRAYGVIAQEIEEVIPEAVTTTEAGDKYMNYLQLIPFLINAIQSQQEEINLLKSKL